MRLLFALIAAVFFSSPTPALTFNGYEQAQKLAESSSAERFMARASIDAYFQGLAETLMFLQAGSQTIFFEEKPFVCFPSGMNITGSMLRGVLDGELKSPNFALRSSEAKWKEWQLSFIVVPLLARTFPCPR
jgi:hypothetical protein